MSLSSKSQITIWLITTVRCSVSRRATTGAVQDYDVVLKQYPTFLPGFVSRSEAKRKLGDNVGADRDYWAAIKMEEPGQERTAPEDIVFWLQYGGERRCQGGRFGGEYS